MLVTKITMYKLNLSELTYFILSTFRLITRHFEKYCLYAVCVCTGVCVYKHYCANMNPVQSVQWPFNVLIMLVTYCALIGQILKLAILLAGRKSMMIVLTS